MIILDLSEHFDTNLRNNPKIIYPLLVVILFYRSATNELTNIQWKPSTEEEPYHLKIGHNLYLVPEKILSERLDFWKKHLG